MDQSYTFDASTNGASPRNSPMINYRKDAKKGVKFTFMVVGESGTGKTTFINSLLSKKVLTRRYESPANSNTVGETKTLTFTSAKSVALPNTSILTRYEFNPRTIHEEPGIALTETQIEIVDDDNQKLFLNIIDTPGFGENLNNEICFIEIENYLKQQFDLVLAEETRIRRNPRFIDTRVHVMLYFITPTGHGLREIDIQCMKRLSKYVNIIPIIGKADSFTSLELQFFKQQIRVDIEKFNIPTFQFDSFLNDYDEDEDYDLIQECKFLSSLQPFAVVCSEDTFEVKHGETGKSQIVTARQYPWGLVDINDTKYSDFPILRSVLLGSHLQDLKDLTHDFLYETYRTERLTKVTGGTGFDDTEVSSQVEPVVQEPLPKNIPSLSNLAQLTESTTNGDFHKEVSADGHSITSTSSSLKKPTTSMLLEEEPSNSPRLRNMSSFTSSASTISLENGSGGATSTGSNGNAFKRLSIGPQRNQLRQLSETVPYVIRHERNLERQAKLEEMEMASAKELAHRAAMLERKAAELKAKERELMRQMEEAKEAERQQQQEYETIAKQQQEAKARQVEHEEEEEEPEPNIIVVSDESDHQGYDSHEVHIEKDATITDLHSIVGAR
ncbi:Septation protein 7 [Spathaspora sp. JA1]|nr:Septation protein 7 [Spathaspora sp. JA1]